MELRNSLKGDAELPLSLIIPVRNGEPFIADTIAELCASEAPFELIVVDDHSTDETSQTVSRWVSRDRRIRHLANPGRGKVQALNFGFLQSRGRVVKFVDADDIMMRGYVNHLAFSGPAADEAECHDMHLTDGALNLIGCYRPHPKIVQGSQRQVIEQLISLPRPSWSFGRALAEHVFPMPSDLPFEDVWFAIVAKRFAARIRHQPGLCYQYRQHGNNTFGGILNTSRPIMAFRAERMLQLIDILVREIGRLEPGGLPFDTAFAAQRRYWELLRQAEVSFSEIVRAQMPLVTKLKLALFRHVPWAVPNVLRCKFGIDALRLARSGRQLRQEARSA